MEVNGVKTVPAYAYPPSYQQGYPQPPPQYKPTFSPPQPDRDEGWCMRNQKNKPQSNSAAGGSLLLVSGGMNIAWSFGFRTTTFYVTKHMLACWFIGAIMGAILSSFIVGKLPKKLILLFSCILVVLGGILFVAAFRDPYAITAARYLDGIGNGLAIVPILMLVGEEAVKSMRGMLGATAETMLVSLGIYLQMIYSSSWTQSMNASFYLSQMQGVLSITYGVLAFIIVFFLLVESPLFYLVRNDETRAIDSLRRLQRPFVVTQETFEQLEEHKRYIAVNNEMSFGESAVAGLPALFKLILYRAVLAMTFSMFVSVYFIAISGSLSWPFFLPSVWKTVVLGSCRWIGTLIAAFMMDTVGRKNPMLFSALVAGGLAFGLGGVGPTMDLLPDYTRKDAALYMLFIFQFFVGAFASSSSVYLTEAFPLKVKPYYVATAYIMEMLVQIIICVCDFSFTGASNYFYILGSFLIIFFAFGLMCLPETKQTTLREAQSKFRSFLSR